MNKIAKFIIIAAISVNLSTSADVIELTESKLTEYKIEAPQNDPADSSELSTSQTTANNLECNDNYIDLKADILKAVDKTFELHFNGVYVCFEDRLDAFSNEYRIKFDEFLKSHQPSSTQQATPRPIRPKPTEDEIFQKVADIFAHEDKIENLRNQFTKQIDEKFEEEVTIIDDKIEEISGRITINEDISELQSVYKLLDDFKQKFTKIDEKLFILTEFTKETMQLKKENAFMKVEATHLKSEIASLKKEQDDLRELIYRNTQELNTNFNIFEFKSVDLSHQICKLRTETQRDLEYLKGLTVHPKSMFSFKENLQEFQEKFDTYAMEVPTRDEDRHPGIHAELLKGFKTSLQELFDKIEELRSESDFSEQEHQIKIMKRKLKNLEMNFEDFKNNPLRVVHPNEAKHAEQHGRMKIFRLGKRLLLKKV
ncbi:unnamed protein product [Chironomus riparius]|uniref:Uncharacterized protein n=1 Tax=Chironomus riparius TaxID=315576 RepID=A0A9N9S8K6_9DIPT|nr:unnamed protein product [Chironomus riparius]